MIYLLNCTPFNGATSVGGTFSGFFNWSFDGVNNCLIGIQNQDILGNTGGTITVDFYVTNPVTCPNNQIGFNANIQPAPCMNGINETTDDTESAYSCVNQLNCSIAVSGNIDICTYLASNHA